MNLSSLIAADVPRTKPAIIFAEEGQPAKTISYASFIDELTACAAALADQGVKRGSFVGILAANHPQYFCAFYALLQLGAVACPLNWQLDDQSTKALAELIPLDFVLHDAPRSRVAESLATALSMDHLIGQAGPAGRAADLGSDDLAAIMFTSGSSGLPKGVPLTHGGYIWALESFDWFRPAAREARSLIAAPYFHMNAQCSVMISLFLGGTVVLMPRFTPELWLDTIESCRVTELTGVPSMMAMMLETMDRGYRRDVSSVNLISLGSAPLSSHLLARIQAAMPGADVADGYGTTETGFAGFGPHPGALETPRGSIGYPSADVACRLESGPSVDEGELWLQTPMTTAGYWKRPDLTEPKRVGDWWRTGDLMRRDANGFYYFVGRADDMFVCGGENLYPGDIEARLERHPDVEQAAVVPVAHDIKGQAPVAFVVPRAGASLTEDAVRTFALDNGPAYAHPRRVWVLDALPLSAAGKRDKNQLAEMAQRNVETA
ncbi:MAG: class I adenylate-forming enzyme family protein [Pseudomonadota bacterium]